MPIPRGGFAAILVACLAAWGTALALAPSSFPGPKPKSHFSNDAFLGPRLS